MPPQPERIAEDLRGLVTGEVLSDELTRHLYATDASQYELTPIVVVRPRVTADVVATVRYAAKESLAVHARGAGSGMAGGCLGEGIVIDFSRYMRRVLIQQEESVTVQAGIVHAVLNRRLLNVGQQFAPDPSSSEMTTLGGMAAIDASGSHRPAYGTTRDHLLGMKVVLADGTIVQLGQGSESAVSSRPAVSSPKAAGSSEAVPLETDPLETTPLKASTVKTTPTESATVKTGPVDHSPMAGLVGEPAGEAGPNRVLALSRSIHDLVVSRQTVIHEQMPHGCANVSGYALDRLLARIQSAETASPDASNADASGPDKSTTKLRQEKLRQAEQDLMDLFVGSEGTLGIITELTLKTTPLPKASGTMLLTFTSLERAAHAVQAIIPLSIAACDLLDRRHIGLARELDPRYELLLSGAAEAILCVEVIADNENELRDKLQVLVATVREPGLAAEVLVAETEEDQRLYRDLRERFVATLHGLKGVRRAATGVEAIALPPPALPQFFGRLQEILKRRQITASIFGHVAHGQLHLRPLLDIANASDMRKLETLASDLYDTVWLLGGTMSGAYGDGLSRTPFASRQHGPLVNVFREVKRLFDPEGILNPGKIVPSPGSRMTHNSRPLKLGTVEVVDASARNLAKATVDALEGEKSVDEPATPLVDLQLSWTPEEVFQATNACNGCGVCRSVEPGGRMCPVFRFAPREEASPRSKANLLRGILTGKLDPAILLREETKQVADLCVNCHMCRLDCPAQVDIPKLMLEAKAAYIKTNGLTISGLLSMRLDIVARWLSKMPNVANWLFNNKWNRWLLERAIGLAAGRKLPKFSDRPYLKSAAARRLHLSSPNAKTTNKPVKVMAQMDKLAADTSKAGSAPFYRFDAKQSTPDKVLYFVDTYANYFDTELAIAFERVIRRHEIEFFTPLDQQHSGMSMISQGAVDSARKIAERNVALLAEAVRQGYRIVATEPSAVLALTHEYRHLLADDEDAVLVAEHTQEACHYLWRRHLDSKLQLDMQPLPLKVAYHVPCHVRALGVGHPASSLMRLIPELQATQLDKGCSGMAGTFGLQRKNYRSSLRAGLPMLSALRTGEYQIGATECGACRTQMEQNSPIRTLHPIKLLAASYGVMPDLYAQLLAEAKS